MDEKTRRALNAINRDFYRASSAAFSATRRDPWRGWTRIPELLEDRLPGRALGILDVGCGNGRFGAYLAGALPGRCARSRYLGVDASAPLLAEVNARPLPFGEVGTRQADFVEDPPEAWLGPERFSLIAAFGVLHHIPGHARRRALLTALAERLEPDGLLVAAFWRFGLFQRFRKRRVPWARFNELAATPIDLGQLEDGDQLLAWGRPGRSVRYCHFANDDEILRLTAAPLCVVDDYCEDGREGALNRYVVLWMKEGA
ncbi:MAG: class I SAM-dependent methyltransferase [Myxococcota bacterium]